MDMPGADDVGDGEEAPGSSSVDVTIGKGPQSFSAPDESGEEVLRHDKEREQEENSVAYDPPPLGKEQPSFEVVDPSENDGRDELYSETGLTDDDVNHMANEVLGKPVNPELVKEEDDDEINFVDKLDEGVNFTDSHPAFDQSWRLELERQQAQARAAAPLRRPRIQAPPAEHFGL